MDKKYVLCQVQVQPLCQYKSQKSKKKKKKKKHPNQKKKNSYNAIKQSESELANTDFGI